MALRQKLFVVFSLSFIVCAFIGILAFAQSSQGGPGPSVLPREVLRPQYGEEPRFPRDYVIGELGRGGATEQSYQIARRLVASIAAGNGDLSDVYFPEHKRLDIVAKINALGTRSWRIGGGRAEGDGGYSFLVRFLGRERSITGELYLQWEEPKPIAFEEHTSEPETELTETENGYADTQEILYEEDDEEVPEAIVEEIVPDGTITESRTNGSAETASNGTAEKTTDKEEATISEDTKKEETNEKAVTQDTESTREAVAAETVVIEPSGNIVTSPQPLITEPRWRVDDLLLEPPRSLYEGRYSPRGADMTPYERFF